ncbi:Amine sulfotransferase-like protein [Dinothrombium tinctorium]|uniref:Amine sulfotransferase-like protein n=1 Tax=Dinothrombium tinctorium TaxID=1965070 RepID=A0A3S3P345_9ACAR|nr:Amine sulfotransferase-like protein [Dinothrombium tinctorium]
MSTFKVPLPIKQPKYNLVQNFKFAPLFRTENIKSGLNYKAKDSDKFIVTFPKCGTTWTMQICVLLFNDGDVPNDVAEKTLYVRIPFLESMGAQAIDQTSSLTAIKTHLPFDLTPYNPNAKYIYVARNPKDACVSFYHHHKLFREYEFDGSFHDFMLCWLNGEIECGSYKDNLLSWWNHKDDDNVLFLLYEEMKDNIREAILKMATFFGKEYRTKIEENAEILNKIVKNSDFTFMKQTTNKSFEMRSRANAAIAENRDYEFIRKGIVGDWKNHFTDEDNQLFEAWFRDSFSGSEIESLWDKYNVFDYRKQK